MIRNNNYFADILRVCELKYLILVMRFQSPLVYNDFDLALLGKGVPIRNLSNIWPSGFREDI